MRRWIPLVILVLALGAGLAAGPSAWGRLMLRAGFPGLAAGLIEAPRWRGVALYEAGRYAEADAAFRRAGRGSTYNRGNTLALTGEYALAVDYYDAVLYVAPGDADALANRAVVAPLIKQLVGSENGSPGKIATDEAPEAKPSTGTYEMNIQALMRGRPKLPRPSDTRQSVAAGQDWLSALPDDPGRYIKLRIKAEHERRVETGTGAPEAVDPW